MKKTSLITGLMAFGAVAFFGAATNAQTVNVNNPGDLLLAFQQSSGTGAAVTLEVDLGLLTNFLSGGPDATGSPVSLTQLAVADLATQYGSNWNSLTTLDWAVIGTNGNNTFSATVTKKSIFGTLEASAPTPTGDNSTAAGGEVTTLETVYGDLGGAAVTANSNFASAISNTDTDNFTGEAGGSPFFGVQAFTGAFQNTTDGTQSLNLWELAPSTTGKDLGTFTLSSSGLTFDSAAAVPEPSTWATILVGAAALLGFRRRRVA